MQIERIEIAKLSGDPANARKHNEQNIATIVASLKRFGQQKPIVIDLSDCVRAGNGTLEAARSLGWTHLDCVRTDLKGSDAIAYAIADNRTAELAEWDDDVLAATLEGLQLEGLLDSAGFSDDELSELMKEIELEGDGTTGEIVEDEVPEPPIDPITKPGDLWLLGDHRLLCGDSTKAEDVERLMAGVSINLAFTSPPYASQRKYDESSGFKPIPPDEFVKWFEPIAANVKQRLAADGSWFVNIKEAADEGQKLDYVKRLVLQHKDTWGWMWIEEYCWPRPALPMDPKTARRFKNGWESVFHFAKEKAFKFRPDEVRHESDGCFVYKDQKAAGKKICDGGQGMGGGAMSPVGQHVGMAYPSNMLPNFGGAKVVGHSAAFPVGLPAFFIKAFTDESDTVYEPFCGSGTTLIAAEQLNRKCYGMEISPAYCDVIVKRWENLTGQKASLDDSRCSNGTEST